MANNDVQHLLDMLYEMIDGAKNAPLTSDKCILNRDEALDLLDELEDCLAGGGSVEEAYDAKELSEAINAFLSSLSYTDRFLFVRRYWYSDSMQDIAAMIGSTANSVAVRLYRLREKLRHYLIREGLLV